MGKGFWLGSIIGFIVAVLVAAGLVWAFHIESPWTIVVGFVCGMFFTNAGIAVGTALDD